MTIEEAMQALRSLSNESTRQLYIKHGAGTNQFGVKFGDLGKLARKIKADTALARQLWATGNTDARMLASLIAKPNELGAEEIETWIRQLSYHGIADMLVRHVIAKREDAQRFLVAWIDDPAEYVAQAGWELVGQMAMNDPALPDSFFLNLLTRIEKNIHASQNRVRYSMNAAVIAIGIRNETLRAAAMSAAVRIGTVHVDHGATGCKTPDACAYIQKTFDYRAHKAKA